MEKDYKEVVIFMTCIIAIFAIFAIFGTVLAHCSNSAIRQHCKNLKDQGVDVHLSETTFDTQCYVPKYHTTENK